MIWLLMNVWWLVPALVGVAALCVFLTAGPLVLRGLSRRIKPWAWQALAAVVAVSLASSWLIGIGEDRCQAKQEKAEAKADVKAAKVAGAAREEADQAKATIRKETSDVQVQIREVVRTVPATCPDMPDELRDLLQRQVEAARAELQAGARDRDRGRAD